MLAAMALGVYVAGPRLSRRGTARVSSVLAQPANLTMLATTPPHTTQLHLSPLPTPARPAVRKPAAADSRSLAMPGPTPPIASPPPHYASYAISLGSFPDQLSADTKASEVAAAGFTASVRRLKSVERVTYELMTPAYTTNDEACTTLAALRAKGFTGTVKPSE